MRDYVVCVGLATRDTILAVPRHPAADDRVVASEAVVAGGGPAATAAVTLARLGVPVFFVGAVGDDATGAYIREGLAAEGVDVSELAVVAGARSPESAILVSPVGRAIAAYRGELGPFELTRRARELCREALWVHVDHAGYAPVTPIREDVRLSIDGGNPIDGLDLTGVAVYGPTERELLSSYGSLEAAFAAGAEFIVVTRGERGSAWHAPWGEAFEAPAYPVEVVSTLGAGDVFHGALLAAGADWLDAEESLAFANRCAALSCRALDGRSAIPRREEVFA